MTMSKEIMLDLLKIDLGIVTKAYDSRLERLITTAKEEIEREGATLSLDSVSDCDLILRYAAWLWRKRDSAEGMPRMIRWQINNRLFGAKEKSND